jgi:hypothetical protein
VPTALPGFRLEAVAVSPLRRMGAGTSQYTPSHPSWHVHRAGLVGGTAAVSLLEQKDKGSPWPEQASELARGAMTTLGTP